MVRFFSMLLVLGSAAPAAADHLFPDWQPPRLLDLSGLVWIGGDSFLAVSDAKNPDELELNRLSLLRLPDSLDGLWFRPISLRYRGGQSSDFESAARVPGTPFALLAESADDDGPFQRIFLVNISHRRIAIRGTVEWSSFTDAFNVEASAVANAGAGLVFIWAERNSGQQSTTIKWADLNLNPFSIGGREGSVDFALPAVLVNQAGNPLYSRSIVGMEVDSQGQIYTVAAFDPEGTVANPDNGPFRSAVLKIGHVTPTGIVLDAEPTILAMVDGLKIESVAVRENGNGVEVFIGTDDENFGGVLRQLTPLDIP
jgi:hypothetical protein